MSSGPVSTFHPPANKGTTRHLQHMTLDARSKSILAEFVRPLNTYVNVCRPAALFTFLPSLTNARKHRRLSHLLQKEATWSGAGKSQPLRPRRRPCRGQAIVAKRKEGYEERIWAYRQNTAFLLSPPELTAYLPTHRISNAIASGPICHPQICGVNLDPKRSDGMLADAQRPPSSTNKTSKTCVCFDSSQLK